MQRALLCGCLCDCNHSIRGADDDELFGEVLAHLRRDHPTMLFPEERIRQFVAMRAYNVEEYVLVYVDGEGPDEEEQLTTARSLEGATMPNGQTYEEWLKNREKENSGP